MPNITAVEGIGPSYAAKLETAGVETTEQLLEKGSTRKGREALVEETGIDSKLILRWVNQVDLTRIKGVGEEYAELLQVAGVKTIPELAQRNAPNLDGKVSRSPRGQKSGPQATNAQSS